MPKSEVNISKFLSLVLRHKPEEIGLELDAAGWVDVEVLLEACRTHNFELSRQQLESVVANNSKQRFAFSADGSRIRASQGHSVEVDLEYEPMNPPEILWHGTAEQYIDSIKVSGLVKGLRQHVHLTADAEVAMKVGQRHGRLVLLEVAAGKMARDGHLFYRSANGVWLADSVPLLYLTFPVR